MAETYKIKVIEAGTGEVVKTMETVTLRAAERIERGLNINLDHAGYYTEIEPPSAHKERAMNPYESGAVIDMNMGHNSATRASIGAPAPRYKIGYRTDEWGERSSTPGGIPDPAGAWVRYDDHVAALAGAAQPVAVPHAQMTEEIDLHRFQSIESAALLALGLLWMTERDNAKVQTAFKTLRDALGSKDALRKGIDAAIEAGYEADHPPGADWWAGKKERHHA